MAYTKLSEQLRKLSHPQRSDAFVKHFRTAVREGQIEAIELPATRFELPKTFTRRGAPGQTYRKAVREMAFEVTPEFEAWFQEIDAQLSPSRGSGTRAPAVSVENIEAGAVDFQALAAATRQKLEASYLKGQQLGQTRKKAKPKGRAKK